MCCHHLFSYLLPLLSIGLSFFLCTDYFFFLFLSLGSLYTMQSNVKCKIISLNVRGIRDQTKRRSIFTYLKDQKAAFYFLQETHSDSNDEAMWQSEWRGGRGGKILFSHGHTLKSILPVLLLKHSTLLFTVGSNKMQTPLLWCFP